MEFGKFINMMNTIVNELNKSMGNVTDTDRKFSEVSLLMNSCENASAKSWMLMDFTNAYTKFNVQIEVTLKIINEICSHNSDDKYYANQVSSNEYLYRNMIFDNQKDFELVKKRCVSELSNLQEVISSKFINNYYEEKYPMIHNMAKAFCGAVLMHVDFISNEISVTNYRKADEE